MRKLIFIVLPFTMISFRGLTQDTDQDQCVRTSNIKTEEIIKNYPFDKAKRIKVVSFKNLDAEAFEYEIPKINGHVDVSKLFEIKTLNTKNKSKLLDILVNINYAPIPISTADDDSTELIEREIRINMCYTPRHAILFEDENGNVFSFVEICFGCLRFKSQPENLKIGDFCYEKYKMLQNLFIDAGLKYGLGQSEISVQLNVSQQNV